MSDTEALDPADLETDTLWSYRASLRSSRRTRSLCTSRGPTRRSGRSPLTEGPIRRRGGSQMLYGDLLSQAGRKMTAGRTGRQVSTGTRADGHGCAGWRRSLSVPCSYQPSCQWSRASRGRCPAGWRCPSPSAVAADRRTSSEPACRRAVRERGRRGTLERTGGGRWHRHGAAGMGFGGAFQAVAGIGDGQPAAVVSAHYGALALLDDVGESWPSVCLSAPISACFPEV